MYILDILYEVLDVPVLGNFNFGTNLRLAGSKYFIKNIFDIIWAINNWLHAHELLYLDRLF